MFTYRFYPDPANAPEDFQEFDTDTELTQVPGVMVLVAPRTGGGGPGEE